MPRRTSAKATQAERRAQVAEMYRKGYTQMQIAVALGTTQGTVSRDVRWLLDEWQKTHVHEVNDAVTKQLDELRELRLNAWKQFEQTERKAWLDVILNVQEREAKLLGLNAPSEIITTHSWRSHLEKEKVDAAEVFAELVNAIADGEERPTD
jgi:predicted transcriptional regulator